MRGKILGLTRFDAIERAKKVAGSAIRYRLKPGFNGGFDPLFLHPGSISVNWPTPGATSLTCDCVGFVMWALGADRYQKGKFPHYGGWINTDSMIEDARTSRSFFAEVDKPDRGDLLVKGGRVRDGVRIPGHVGMVVARNEDGSPSLVTHCSAGNDRLLGYAISTTPPFATVKPGGRTTYVRYLKFEEE